MDTVRSVAAALHRPPHESRRSMMSVTPKTMPAVGYLKSLPIDDAESLLDLELPVPQPGPHDLLVQVEAIAVNPVDYKVRQGNDPGGEPKVLGWDAAGTVVGVGDRVELFEVGDEVFYAGAIDRPGTNSRFHTVDERIVGRKPARSPSPRRAALPLTSLTAWEGLFEHLGLRQSPEQTGTLLVTAAAGGVGAMVAQLGPGPHRPDRDRYRLPPGDPPSSPAVWA
ncbi:alcohol dehydrogenase catalytic domain-containing protein [Streptomyces sp. L7]